MIGTFTFIDPFRYRAARADRLNRDDNGAVPDRPAADLGRDNASAGTGFAGVGLDRRDPLVFIGQRDDRIQQAKRRQTEPTVNCRARHRLVSLAVFPERLAEGMVWNEMLSPVSVPPSTSPARFVMVSFVPTCLTMFAVSLSIRRRACRHHGYRSSWSTW